MRTQRSGTALALAFVFAGCSSVDVPEDRFFAIEIPAAAAAAPLVDVLRVADLSAVGAFGQDHIVITDGVRYAPRPLERWVVPADRMLTDVLVVALSRYGVAGLVVASSDPGSASWQLHGRLLEFAEVLRDGGNVARLRLELWLTAGDELLLRREFAAEEPVGGAGVEAVVAALSRCTDRVISELVAALRTLDLPGGDRAVSGL